MNSIFKAVAVLVSGLCWLAGAAKASAVPAAFDTATTVPVTAASYAATGNTVDLALNFTPLTGTSLTVVNNTGPDPIQGTFGNLAQGQVVALNQAAGTFLFVANYFGGTGNDLVLQWANTRVFAWGYNGYGQVGNNSTATALLPVAVDPTGVIANKAVVAVAAGGNYDLAVCSDGTVAAWGDNGYGQLGNNSNTSRSTIPVLVSQSGALANSSVVAIAAGGSHVLALRADGSLVAWGSNGSGRLGNNSTNSYSREAVAVDRSGILAGKQVIALAAGLSHSLALCADGTLVAWGANNYGQLGNNSTTSSAVPVAVNASGLLAGKRVTAIAAGDNHNLALCADGTLVAWGFNIYGQLGNNNTINALVPVAVNRSGPLAGRTVTMIGGGESHSVALCSDGSLAAWGYNVYGMLGNNSTTNSSVPVAVDRTGVLAGKIVTTVTAAGANSFALCADGTLAAWGRGSSGSLGNNGTAQSKVPVLVTNTNLAAGERFIMPGHGPLALVASPPHDLTPGIADGSAVIGTTPSLSWSLDPLASSYAVYFGTDPAAVASATATSPEALGSSATNIWSGSLPPIAPAAQYFWRVDTVYATGIRTGKVWSFRISPLEMPVSINAAAVKGMGATTLNTPITSALPGPQPWAVSLPNAPAWLGLVASSGTTPQPLGLRFAPGSLAAGTYTTTVRIVSGTSTVDVLVTFQVDELGISKFLPDPSRPVIYAINKNAKEIGQVIEIDALTHGITRSVTVGKEPTDLDLTEDGRQLIVMNTTNPSLSRIDLESFAVTETINLTNFSNRNDDFGGHVKCGKGAIVYYVDEQWGPRLRVFDTATKTVLQTFSAESGTTPDLGNNYGYGDINLTPDRSKLFGWRQYGDGAGVGGTHVVRFTVNADGTLGGFAKSNNYSSANFTREPFNTPVLLTRDGTRLIIKDRVVDQTDLNSFPVTYPDEIYSVAPGGEITASTSAIYPSQGGEILATLPVTTSIQAILPDYSALVYFNPTTKAIGWLDLVATVGTSRLGLEIRPADGATVAQPSQLKWLPVTGITRYQVYLGTNRSEVEAATPASATYLGEVADIRLALSIPLTKGQTYFWRVVPVTAGGQTAGAGLVYSFTASNLALSRGSISAETVQGVHNHEESITLSAATPQGWTASANVPWIRSLTASGTTPGTLVAVMDASSLAAGSYQGQITLVTGGTSVAVPVDLKVYAANFMISKADLELPYVYVVSQESNTSNLPSFLVRINTGTNQMESAIPCGRSVTDLAIHYAENRIYLTNWQTGVLRAFDRTSFSQVQSYQFAPVGPIGYGEGGIWKVSAGKQGRVILEESDQWIDIRLIDTSNGAVLATNTSQYAGDGDGDPTGRYYYHSEALSSNEVTRFDLSADTFVAMTPVGTAYAGTVVPVPDGSKVAVGTKLFDAQLGLQMTLSEAVAASTVHGEILFTNKSAINGFNNQTLAGLPVDTTIQAVSADQKKLYQFKAGAFTVVDITAIAVLPPRGLVPGIADGFTVIGTSRELTWSQEPTALSYDVYFGTSAAAVAAATKTSAEYLGNVAGTKWTGNLPPLALGASYYWRVDINGFTSVKQGTTWSIGVATMDVAPRAVSIASPAGAPVARQSLALSSASPVAWSASTTTPWITLRSVSGSTPGTLQFDISTTGMTVGAKSGSITFQAAGQTFSVPVDLSIVTLNVTQLVAHPIRPVVYGINTALAGEGFSYLLEIDAATSAILRTMPIGSSPSDADLDPATGLLYISNWGYPRTRVIDVDNWLELPSLDLGTDIYKLEVTPKGKLVTEGQDQWVSLKLWEAATGASVASATGSIREGDGQADPTGNFYYHCDNNSSGAIVAKYDISNNTFVKAASGPQIGYGSRNLILSPDGSKLFWMGRVMDADLNTLSQMPAEVYATNRTGDLAVGSGFVWWSDSATQVAALPFASTVASISAADAYLVRFNATTRTLNSTSMATLTDLPGPRPRPGQVLGASPQQISWSPVAGATGYRLYIAADAAALAAMTNPVATVATASYDLAAPLAFGRFYSWRADAETANGVVTGSVQSFGIRFPQGPALPKIGNGSTGIAASISDLHLLIGLSEAAQLYDFDPATGAASALQSFSLTGSSGSNYFGSAVAVDAAKAVVGAYAFANPASGGGAAYVFRPGTSGYWENSGALLPPAPVANEAFGRGLAASGNLMLAGTGNTYNTIGRVAAYVTEPTTTRVQVFSAADAVAGDGFGYRIAIDGNRAIIAAPGKSPSYSRVACLYAFSRSTTTGQWSQTQKITITGASSSDSVSGMSLALDGNTMATRNGAGVVIYTRNVSGQWVQSATIAKTTVAGSSSSFGVGLALSHGQLFVGDTGATNSGTSGGAVFSFRSAGAGWVAGPAIIPTGSYSNFGAAVSARDGWLLAAGGSAQPAWLFRIDAVANHTPRFIPGLPSQAVAGRAFNTAVRAEDADGNAGLVMDLLQGPAWLHLTDGGSGNAVLSGTPVGGSGDVSEIQLRVRDSAGAQAIHTYRLTLLAATDLPVLTAAPSGGDLGVGQELTLRAAVTGVGPFQWQWYRDGKPIDGATRDTLFIGELALADAGTYQVRVSNIVGEAVSSDVTVTVHPANRFAGDWPTFGGSPAHNGRHPAALDGFNLVPAWSQTVQSGYALNRAAIVGGRAFVVPQSRFATGIEAKALDLTTGTQLWSFGLPSSNSTNPPTVYNGRVYFQRGKGTSDPTGPQLFCLNADTGAQLWASGFGAQWESYEAPAVSDLGVFINGGTYGGMYGFNFDGSQRFFKNMAQYDDWTPTIANGRLFSWVAGLFQEHNPADGSMLWSVNTGWDWRGWSMNNVSAVAGDSALVFNNTEMVCIDLPSRSIRWRTAGIFTGSFAIGAGKAYAIQGNAVRSYALEDGTPGPVYQTSPTPNNSLIDQPVLFNDRLLISDSARTWVFNLDDGQLLQTLDGGGRLSYSDSYLLAAGNDGTLRAFIALSNNPRLKSLALGDGTMLPGFETLTTNYIATVPFTTAGLMLTPTTEHPGATVQVNGMPVASGAASGVIPLVVGNNTLTTLVTAEDGITTMTYTIIVNRLPQDFVFNSASDVPVTANGFSAGGYPVNVKLNFAPFPGTILTMVNNNALGFIHGRFGNLAQGQRIGLAYGGVVYDFVANYFGGTGNDLVLQWAGTELTAWGNNNYGQLGDGGTERRLLPTGVDHTGVLAGKTIVAVSAGYLHSLALCSDGTLASWGYNAQGQLGNDGTAESSVPVEVDRSDAFAGKTVIAISAGPFHNLALCSDGSIAAWGYNNYGQLGTGDKITRRTPTMVIPAGALAGKQVVGIATGAYHSFARCADGSVVAWGYNDEGELGDNSTITRLVPVIVDMSGVFAGKKIASLSAGQYHTLALCTDGTLVAWGYNQHGELGNDTVISIQLPVAINSFGALSGKTVSSIAAGGSHSLALCTDGALTAWGLNNKSQLGAGGIGQSPVPITVAPWGKTINTIAAGGNHSMALSSEGLLFAWGDNANGQLGDNTTTTSESPSLVDSSALTSGSRFMAAATGSASLHSLAIVGLPPSSAATGIQPSELPGDQNPSGITNLVERAFALDRTKVNSGNLPLPQRIGDNYVIEFTEPENLTGITYGAQSSVNLKQGSWVDIPDTGSGPHHIFSVPAADGKSIFFRLKVSE